MQNSVEENVGHRWQPRISMADDTFELSRASFFGARQRKLTSFSYQHDDTVTEVEMMCNPALSNMEENLGGLDDGNEGKKSLTDHKPKVVTFFELLFYGSGKYHVIPLFWLILLFVPVVFFIQQWKYNVNPDNPGYTSETARRMNLGMIQTISIYVGVCTNIIFGWYMSKDNAMGTTIQKNCHTLDAKKRVSIVLGYVVSLTILASFIISFTISRMNFVVWAGFTDETAKQFSIAT